MGGQAVLEGVMMRSPRFIAVAVRKPDGTIATMHERIDTFFHRSKPFKLFPLRGVVSLTEMFLLGLKALSFSAKEASDEEEDFGKKEIALSFIFAFVFVTLLFILLPAYLSGLTHIYVSATWLRSLVEGVLRVTIFLIYIVAVSRMSDIKRVFQYHGAEHKTVHAYEHGEELKTDVVQRYSPLHVGCGTGYLLTVMVVAIFVFAFIPRTSLILRVLIQLLLIPVISTVTFEIIKLARRYESKKITRVLMSPGMFLQKLTAREPDDSQIEVAVTALKEAIRLEEEA